MCVLFFFKQSSSSLFEKEKIDLADRLQVKRRRAAAAAS